MTTIITKTSDQVLSASILPKVACNNQKTVRLHIDFDDVWSGYAKSAVFYTEKDKTRYEAILSGDGDCLIPAEVLADEGKLYIGVKGVKNDTVKTSTILTVKVLAGTPSMIISDPAASVYAQLLQAYATERARIDNLAKLPTGSTAGDAELADIRVGADGVTHSTAGGAVRAQAQQLFKATATDLTFEQGTLTSAEGKPDIASNRIRTGYLLAENFISAKISSGFIIALFQYGANLGYISTSGWLKNGVDKSLLVDGCKYIRIAIAKENATSIATTENTGFVFSTRQARIDSELDNLSHLFKANISFASGTISSTNGTETDNNTRIRTGFLDPHFNEVLIGTGFYINLFQYDKDFKFLESTGFVTETSPAIVRKDCAYIRFVISKSNGSIITPDEETGFVVYKLNTSIDEMKNEIKEVELSYHKCKFNGEVMNTAYSSIGVAPINTAEHFLTAAHLGFNALKGDVRITADNKLIMCHDAGFTFDANGRITSFNSSNCTNIVGANYDNLMKLEYASSYDSLGHYSKVCDFDTFVRICKETGKIAYVTLRENKIAELVAEVMRILNKYHMQDRCVINSYTLATLQEVRKYNKNIPLSQVISLGATLSKATVDNVKGLGNGIVTMFLYPTDNPLTLWEQSADALTYAQENNIQIHMAQVDNYADYSAMVQRGVQGFHILKPFLNYGRKEICFVVAVSGSEIVINDYFNTKKFTAETRKEGGYVFIKNIANKGSGYGFDDALPAVWMNRLPYNISVKGNTNCSIAWQNNELVLNTNNISGTYYVTVCI